MDNHAVVDQIVQSLSFEVEAVPNNKTVELTNSSKGTPLNVKIRVRKKENLTMRRGVISIPKFDDPETIPQKIRLVNSDQTIMSFDVFMEAEFEKKPVRKPRKHIFDMLKPGICLGASDDDDYPHLPSSSYSANVAEDNANSRSDGVLKHNFTLSKNTYDEYGDPTKGKTFLGKCKPGGCLDPAFDEDKYSYKPVIQVPALENEENTLKKENVQDSEDKKGRLSSVFDSNIFKKKRKTSDQSTGTKGSCSIKGNQTNSILSLYQAESTVNSLSTTHSNSIITYPPALASSELPMSDENNRSRVSSEDRSRKSFNEYTDAFFIPPKGINKMKDKNKYIKSDADEYNSKIKEIDKNNKKTKPTDTLKLPMPIPIPVPIPIKSETVNHQTSAPDVEKYNRRNNGPKLVDSRVLLEHENEIDVKLPNGVNLTDKEVGKEDSLKVNSNTMEAKYVTLDDFDNFKQDTLSDTDSEHINLSQVSISSQHLLKQEEKEPMNKTKLIKGQSIEGIHQQPSKGKEEEPPQRNGSIKGAPTKDSPRHSLKRDEEGSPNRNATFEEPHTNDSPRHTFKHEKEGSPNINATIEEPQTNDSPRHSFKHEKEGSPNINATIEGPFTKDSPRHSFKQEKERSPNRNATIQEPYTKDSPRHSFMQEKEGSPNINATIEGPFTKDSPRHSFKQEKERSPNRNATIEEPQTNDSPRHSFEHEKEGSSKKNATIEGPFTKYSPRHSFKRSKERSPNRNATFEEPHTNDSPRHSFKREKERSPNRKATIEEPQTNDSPRHSFKHEKEGSPNRNATIGVPYTKQNPRHSLKQEKEGSPNANATIEGPYTKDSPRHSFKHEKEGSPNINATIGVPYTKESPRHSLKQEKEGSPNTNATIEGPYIKDSPRNSFKQAKERSPNRNATIQEPYTKDSPRHSFMQEKEGSLNINATIEGLYTKDSPRNSFMQEKERSPNRNATMEEPYTKDSPRHSFMQDKEGSPNRNATIEGPYTKASPRHSFKQEKERSPNRNATIQELYTKDSPQHSLKQVKEGLPNSNATIEGLYIKDSPRNSFMQEKERSPNRNATMEEPYTKDSPRHSFMQDKEGSPNRNATIEGPYIKDSPRNSFKQAKERSPNRNATIQETYTKDSPRHSFLQEKEGSLNINATIEGLYTKDSPRNSFMQEKERSPNRNATMEEPYTKDSPRHSFMQDKEGSPNRNATIEGPYTKASPRNSFMQENEGSPNRNATIEGPYTKDSSRNSFKQAKERSPNRNATIEGPYTKDSSRHSFKRAKERSPNRNATMEEPDTKDSSRHSFEQEKEGSPNTNATIEGPYTSDSPRNSFKQEQEGSPNRNATIEGLYTKDSPRHSFKREKERSPNRNGPYTKDNSENTFKQELRKHEISHGIMPPEEDYVQSMDTAEKPTGLFLNESDLNHKDNLEEKLEENEEAIAHNMENIIDFEYSERTFQQKSPSFSEPGIFERIEADLDSNNIYQNDNEIIPSHIDMNTVTNDEVSGNYNITLQNDTDIKILESYNSGDDLLSADRNSQIDRPIKDSSDIIKQTFQSLKDTEYIEASTGEMIDNSYNTAQATIDTRFKKLGSVDSETNLVDEHSIDIENEEQYDLDKIQWKAALRTGVAEVEDDHDSSASPSIIRSTKNKGAISPNKRVVIPMYNSVSTETLTKSGETPDESKLLSNALDKQQSKSRSYVESASSSIPSTSTLKSVLKKDTITVDLAFQSYVNEKNERVLKTFDMAIEPKRYSNDSITLVKSQVRLSANEIRIPIDSENDMFIHIKKASVNQHVVISESELVTGAKHDLKSSDSRYPLDIINREFLHDNLLEIYEQELVPLQIIIKALKDEIDVLASQQIKFKEKVYSPKKIKPPRVVHSNRRCGCLKKI